MIRTSQTKSTIDHIIEEVDKSSIASTQRVISEIIRVMNDPLSTAKDLKEIIEVDPPLTLRVLRRANSVYYARQRKISGIQEAIIWIGFSELKELTLNQKVYELFNQTEDDVFRVELWKESVAAAICGKLIYRREFGEIGDNAYAAGLLHNIGIIIEDQFLPESFKEIFDEMEKGSEYLFHAERKILGFDHAELGKSLADHWNLPDELVTGIGYHHLPQFVEWDPSRLAKTIYIADIICQDLGIGYLDPPLREDELYYSILEEFSIEEKGIHLIKDEVEHKIVKMTRQGWF